MKPKAEMILAADQPESQRKFAELTEKNFRLRKLCKKSEAAPAGRWHLTPRVAGVNMVIKRNSDGSWSVFKSGDRRMIAESHTIAEAIAVVWEMMVGGK
jgi:hypothetical protein